MYTYEVSGDPVMCKIFKDGTVIDHSGPWESSAAATQWAELFVAKCNAGFTPFGA
jgi:hypothetical protein